MDAKWNADVKDVLKGLERVKKMLEAKGEVNRKAALLALEHAMGLLIQMQGGAA